MSSPPTGTVTFLFSDIEGSTRLAQAHPSEWEAARQRHHAILRAAFEMHHGYVFQIIGDAVGAAFPSAGDALQAAVATQRGIRAEPWSDTPLSVRMGLHTSPAEAHAGDYRGYLTLVRVQRVMAAAHGGQILLSGASAELLRTDLSEGMTLREMGEHRLKGLLNPEHLWQVVAPDLPQDFPPLQSLNAIPNNLPIQVTSFVGREKEIAEVKQLLTTTRLLTLTGSGGTGKTRLSLQVAAEVFDSPAASSGQAPSAGSGRAFKDGVWFVELAPLSDPSLVPIIIASVLGVREEQGRPLMATLLEWLRPKELLLILDNCEHLIDACARFADAAIHASRGTRILASSREALGIAGELAYHVPSLPTPNPSEAVNIAQFEQYAAVRLFIERAAFALPTFAVTNANAPAVAQICYRLDGIPLAIELAAARVKALSAEQIAARLDDRFRLLTGGSRTALPRQQTLRGAIDWSHSLLPEAERSLLRRLSAFAGGWTLEAAEEVCADDSRADGRPPLPAVEVLDLLTHLVEKSLVVAEEESGEARYHLLETMRQYAREKLLESDETNAIRDRHLAHFLKLAEEAEPQLTAAAQATWFARLERDYANLRAALEWSLQESDASHGMRLASALATFWFVRGPTREGVDWLVRAVSRREAAEPSLVRAKALSATARLLSWMGEQVRSNPYLEQSLVLSRALAYRPGEARALVQLGMNARLQGDLKTAKSLLEQSLAIREGLAGDVIVSTYVGLGLLAEVEDDYDAARTYLEQAMSVAQAADSSHNVALSFGHLGALAILQRDYDGAEAAFAQGLNAGRAVGHKGAVSLSSRGLAYVALQRGQMERAAAFCRESLLINREWRHSAGLARSLGGYAALAVARGQPERAARLYGSAAARLVGYLGGRHRYPHDQAKQERHIDELRAQLDEARFNNAWEAGRILTMEQAVALALEETTTR
jgi:predicted ATPase/class 3 adenylate cyclase